MVVPPSDLSSEDLKLWEQGVAMINALNAVDAVVRQEIIELIGDAFDGVPRGDAMSLHEIWVGSRGGTEEECRAARDLDTEERWQDVPDFVIADLGCKHVHLDKE